MTLLVVVAGPIGAGKSTVADLLGQRFARVGSAAVVDLDDVAFMQRDVAFPEVWRRSAIATAALIRGWFEVGTSAVVAHGPFFEADGYRSLLCSQDDEVEVRHVLLRVSYETALTRVSGENTRGMSRDPEFLRRTHQRFRRLESTLPEMDFVFDTESVPADAVADEIAAAVHGLVA